MDFCNQKEGIMNSKFLLEILNNGQYLTVA